MIVFKSKVAQIDFHDDRVSRDLKVMLLMISVYASTRWNLDIVVTSVFGVLDSGVVRKSTTHEDGRAVDIRTKAWSFEARINIVDWINNTFTTGVYFKEGNPMRPAIYHDVGHGEHIHLQVATRPVMINLTVDDPILI